MDEYYGLTIMHISLVWQWETNGELGVKVLHELVFHEEQSQKHQIRHILRCVLFTGKLVFSVQTKGLQWHSNSQHSTLHAVWLHNIIVKGEKSLAFCFCIHYVMREEQTHVYFNSDLDGPQNISWGICHTKQKFTSSSFIFWWRKRSCALKIMILVSISERKGERQEGCDSNIT